ncbi:MAG: methyltransferase domain-containing protein [Clostridia bacterium]|nr:methyltransferase domain-containing protein [Clostridia bacterium]
MRDLAKSDWVFFALTCPVCGAGVSRVGGTVRCPSNHSFDLSAKGTLNLSRAAGKNHGDDAGMIGARRRFLSAGYYAPLSEALSVEVKNRLPDGGIILDAGCGEGYYTAAVANRNPGARLIALDLSSEAIRECAGRTEARDGRIFPLVAGVYRLPIRDASLDGLISAFSPYAGEEFLRVLRPGGYLFRAIPDRRHLFALKEILYDQPYENEVADFESEGFEFCGAKEIKTAFTMKTPAEIADLLNMTPYGYRTPPAGKARLAATAELSVEAEFILLTYRRI